MLARLKKPDGNIKLVDNVAEMREIHETMKEMKADLPRASKLQSDFNKHKVEEVMSVFGEVRELEELLGEFPGLDDCHGVQVRLQDKSLYFRISS